MKFKKAFLLTSMSIIASVLMLSIGSNSYATTDTDGKLLGITVPTYRASGYAYTAGFLTTSKEQSMWKIYEYNANGTTIKNYNNGIYCLKAGPGFGSVNGSTTGNIQYTQI